MRQPIKWHGGKNYLAAKIVELMPTDYIHYVEPYFGGGSVLLANNPDNISEVVNDINKELTTFWKVLQDDDLFKAFKREIEAVPFSEIEYKDALDTKVHETDNVSVAIKFFIKCRQSLAGRMTGFTGITKTRTRRGMNNEVSAWLSAIDGLPEVHNRMKRVLILNRPALDVIKSQDEVKTLFYLDPPYLKETRSVGTEYGQFEMSDEDHADLLEVLTNMKGKFLLSGYRSYLYEKFAEKHKWRRHDFRIPNHASHSKEKKMMTESVWMNY